VKAAVLIRRAWLDGGFGEVDVDVAVAVEADEDMVPLSSCQNLH
jgi:hypothetical protein